MKWQSFFFICFSLFLLKTNICRNCFSHILVTRGGIYCEKQLQLIIVSFVYFLWLCVFMSRSSLILEWLTLREQRLTECCHVLQASAEEASFPASLWVLVPGAKCKECSSFPEQSLVSFLLSAPFRILCVAMFHGFILIIYSIYSWTSFPVQHNHLVFILPSKIKEAFS